MHILRYRRPGRLTVGSVFGGGLPRSRPSGQPSWMTSSTGHRGRHTVPAATLEVGQAYGDVAGRSTAPFWSGARSTRFLHCGARSAGPASPMVDPAQVLPRTKRLGRHRPARTPMRGGGRTAHRPFSSELPRPTACPRENPHPRVRPRPADQRLRRDEALASEAGQSPGYGPRATASGAVILRYFKRGRRHPG